MEDYFKPDKRWEIYGYKSQEEYAEKVVIEGYFHDQVSGDVVQAFKTAEYLMAHAYYHWEMFDEAFVKSLLTVELAVKQKAQLLGIAIDRKNKKGEKIPISLGKIIKKLCKPNYFQDLKRRLTRLQDLRNRIAHPRQHSFAGPHGNSRNILYSINVVNRLFQDDEWHIARKGKLSEVQKCISNLNKHQLAVESENKSHVIFTCSEADIIDDSLLLICIPLIDVTKLEKDQVYIPGSVTYTFNNYSISGDSIRGFDQNGKEMKLYVTTESKSIHAKELFLSYLKDLNEKDPYFYPEHVSYDSGWNMVEAEYQYYSNEYQACHSMN